MDRWNLLKYYMQDLPQALKKYKDDESKMKMVSQAIEASLNSVDFKIDSKDFIKFTKEKFPGMIFTIQKISPDKDNNDHIKIETNQLIEIEEKLLDITDSFKCLSCDNHRLLIYVHDEGEITQKDAEDFEKGRKAIKLCKDCAKRALRKNTNNHPKEPNFKIGEITITDELAAYILDGEIYNHYDALKNIDITIDDMGNKVYK